ncbi:hypothetical protein SRABI128_05445 [Microbacterium sp. Bi128]|nr:hypothetical protein SRABI128_05445 [Microbacterium sp. Bi128]
MLEGIRVLGQQPKIVEAEVRLVQRRDLQGDRPGRALNSGALPFGVDHDKRFGARHEVEPVPAAVAEGRKGQLKGVLRRTLDAPRVDALQGSAGVGLVDDDGSGALGADLKPDLVHRRPAPPVARREGVEVAAERYPLPRTDLGGAAGQEVFNVGFLGGAAEGLCPGLLAVAAADRRKLDAGRGTHVHVQGNRVHLAGVGQDDPLQGVPLLGGIYLGVGCGAHASTPPLSIFAPPSKCGRILLSNMVRAEPIAMCMSRYL